MVLYVRFTVVVVLVLVLQVELFSELRLWGVMPELLMGTTVATAWAAGPDRGAVVGFVAGLLYDLYLPTPLALSALTYVLVAYGVGNVSAALASSGERRLRQLVTLCAVAAGIMLFVTLGELLGQPNLYTDRLVTIVIVATLYTTLLMTPIRRLVLWALGDEKRPTAPKPLRLEVVE